MRIVALAMGGGLLAIGAALLLGAASFFSADSELAAGGGRATGNVIEVEYYRSAGGKRMYRPHVRFIDGKGQSRTFVSNLGSYPSSYEKGEAVEVMYDPADPARAEIDSFASRHLGTLVFGLFGAVFTMLGIVVTVRAVR